MRLLLLLSLSILSIQSIYPARHHSWRETSFHRIPIWRFNEVTAEQEAQILVDAILNFIKTGDVSGVSDLLQDGFKMATCDRGTLTKEQTLKMMAENGQWSLNSEISDAVLVGTELTFNVKIGKLFMYKYFRFVADRVREGHYMLRAGNGMYC